MNKKKNSKDMRKISERFCSKYLNDGKLSLLKKVDEDNIRLKNEMSDVIFKNKHLLLTSSKYDLVKMFASSFKSQYLKAWNVQTMFADVAVMYLNYVNALKGNLQLKVTEKPITIVHYKKSTKQHKAGDVKEVIQHKHWTPFTKLLKAIALANDKSFFKAELKQQHDYYISKFGEKRVNDLAGLIKQNLLKRIHKIQFTTGTWRCCHSYNGKLNRFIDNTNALYKHWMKLDLRKEFGDMYIPLQVNDKYHDFEKSLNSSWLVKCTNNKVQVIGTKQANELCFKDECNVAGIDLNVKHNFCTVSDGKAFDYDRTYVKQLCKELKKLDKIGLKNITDTQKKHLNKICKRNEWYFKKLISEVLQYCEQNGMNDIVLEDLELFGGTYTCNAEFEVKYSRLVRLLRLNSVKDWMKQQAEKRGLRVHLTPSYYSSQQCPECRNIDSENRKTQEEFECCSCGHHDNADLNAAKNLKLRFIDVLWRRSLHDVDAYGRLIPKAFIRKDFVKSVLSKKQTSLYCNVSQFKFIEDAV